MVETFTPAVCGSKTRQRLALAGFAIGALGASALVGAALGALGAFLGLELALAVAALALLAAARESGFLRFPLPQVRGQVPERWRSVLPLPVWSVGYGAGLGAGFFTFQPVSTFWVACAGALALGRPLSAALCFTAYGAGRTLMAMAPRRGKADATAAVEALVDRRRLLLGLNVAALLVCAALLAAPSAGAASDPAGQGFDPSARGSVVARALMQGGGSSVVVEPEGESPVPVPEGAAPSIDGDLLAYTDDQGIKIIDWRTSDPVAEILGAVSKPALDWPLLAFVRRGSEYQRLILADFSGSGPPTEKRIASVRVRHDLGRPSLAGGRLAWHKITRREARVFSYRLSSGNRRTIDHSKMYVPSNPALSGTRILWVEQRPKSASLFIRRFGSSGARQIYKYRGRDRRLLTTALTGRTAYVTRWAQKTGSSTLVRVTF
jgi:hypothetical protein